MLKKIEDVIEQSSANSKSQEGAEMRVKGIEKPTELAVQLKGISFFTEVLKVYVIKAAARLIIKAKKKQKSEFTI